MPKKSTPSPRRLTYISRNLRPLAVPVSSLKLDEQNARRHPKTNIAALTESLRRFGQQKPIVITPDGTVIAGNGLLAAAKKLGWKYVAATRTDLKDRKARAYALADNRTNELSSWDEQILLAQIRLLQDAGDDMNAFGFAREINRLVVEAMEEQSDLDVLPAPPDEPVTKPGDLWLLGDHRLLCGDAGNAEDVDRLLDGAAVHLVNTDPPYNVGVASRSNNAIAASGDRPIGQQGMDIALRGKKSIASGKLRPKDRPLVNDFMPNERFAHLLRLWFGNIHRVLVPGRSFYIWGGYSNIWNYPNALRESHLYFSQMIIWVKEHPVLTRKDFMGNHEWCFYGWKEGAAHRFFGPPNVTDVWSVKKVNPQSMVHLTEKPVELAVRPIIYSSQPGENVLDLFGGSGSTLIAAEKTHRRAFLMEIDPLYCDVIVQRYERFTGKSAVLAGRRRGKRRRGAVHGSRSY